MPESHRLRLAALPAPHRSVWDGVVANFTRQPGIWAIWLEGSWARGTGDAYSDLDLRVVVAAEAWRTVWERRHQLAASAVPMAMDLDHQFAPPASPVLSYAAWYETGVYLDLTLVQADGAAAPGAVRLWRAGEPAASADPSPYPAVTVATDPFDDAVRMFWMGSPLCAKYLKRGQLWTALWFLESRRAQFLKAWRVAHASPRADWSWSDVEADLPADVLAELSHTVTRLEAPAMWDALARLMALMARCGPELAARRGSLYPKAKAAAIADIVAHIRG